MTTPSVDQDEAYFARREECRESHHNGNYRAPITGEIPRHTGTYWDAADESLVADERKDYGRADFRI